MGLVKDGDDVCQMTSINKLLLIIFLLYTENNFFDNFIYMCKSIRIYM